ncbi:hypothetical protein [Plebeiibacterium sediminum]|uniref:Uncharacterized protein n=1 Tax=Plebeiibacterium sediminum TaxID=2992112 RepID=A0AAE3M4T7_9BACT|nr:hypothetical protein [Plebeiobacterium sediminum]MCW3787222.1 hypothetical protein [Plebeiobacterium sediminum]
MKKQFTGGLDSLIQNSKNNIKTEKEADKEKSKSGIQKATYYFNSDDLELIKAIAFYERRPIGDLIGELMKKYITNYPDLDKVQRLYRSKC